MHAVARATLRAMPRLGGHAMARQAQPNTQLAALLAEACFSHKGLADRVVNLGAIRSAPGLRYNHSSVARWLDGQQPRRPVPDTLAELFTIDLGHRVTVADLGMRTHTIPADLGLELPATQSGG